MSSALNDPISSDTTSATSAANGSAMRDKPRATERAHRTVDRVASAAHSYTDSFAAASDVWMQRQDEMLLKVRDYVREKPMQAIGIAVAAGFVLSKLMSGRD